MQFSFTFTKDLAYVWYSRELFQSKELATACTVSSQLYLLHVALGFWKWEFLIIGLFMVNRDPQHQCLQKLRAVRSTLSIDLTKVVNKKSEN